jgi:hypothetical protein
MDLPHWQNQRTRLDVPGFEPCELEAVVGRLNVAFWLDGKEAVAATAPVQLFDYMDEQALAKTILELRKTLKVPKQAVVHEHWLTPISHDEWFSEIVYRIHNGQLEKRVPQ